MSISKRFGRISRKKQKQEPSLLPKRPNRFVSYIQTLPLKKLTATFAVAGFIVLLVGSYLWYANLYMTSERRFWLAINNAMSLQSITREIVDGGSGNQVVQTQRFHFSPQRVSESQVQFTQRSATNNTFIETEGIASPSVQYSRYTAFETNQTREDGTKPSLDDVLGVWSEQTFSPEELEQSELNYTGELVTLAILGNFDGAFRRDMIDNMKKTAVYGPDLNKGIEDVIDGEKVIRYQVAVNLKAYVTNLQASFVKAGYGEFPPLAPENYRDGSVLTAEFVVNARSNTLVGINYGSRQEQYVGHGIRKTVEYPAAELTTEELEQRVQEELQGAL